MILFFKLLKHRHEDVVIYVNTMLPFGAALAGKLMGKPVYYHVHETSLTPASFKRFLRFMVQKAASKVIFVSKSVADAESFANMPQAVIYNALPDDLAKVAETNQYKYKSGESFNVLMICSLKVYKGVEEFLRVAELCEVHQKITFTLVLNAEQSELDAYFAKRVLPSNVTLDPRQNNLIPYYEKASLVLNLSRVDECVETFGLTIIEAMAFGIPVIVPAVGGPTEIVKEGKEGFLISSYDMKKIAEKIEELSKNQSLCQELSNNARKRVLDFSEGIFFKKIHGILFE